MDDTIAGVKSKPEENTLSLSKELLSENLPELYHCGRCGLCCTTFYSGGPSLNKGDLSRVVGKLAKEGLNKEAEYAKKYWELPTQEGNPLERACSAYDSQESSCRIHSAKPDVCLLSPNHLFLGDDNILLVAHFYGNSSCRRGMRVRELKGAVESLRPVFLDELGMDFSLRVVYPVENRACRFFEEEP